MKGISKWIIIMMSVIMIHFLSVILSGCSDVRSNGSTVSVDSASDNVSSDFNDVLSVLSSISMDSAMTYDDFYEKSKGLGKLTSRDHMAIGKLDGSGDLAWSDVSMINLDFDIGDNRSIPITYIRFNDLDTQVSITDYLESAKHIPVYPLDDAIKSTEKTYRLSSNTEKTDYFDIMRGYVEHVYDLVGEPHYDYYDVYLYGDDYCVIILGVNVDTGIAESIKSFLEG